MVRTALGIGARELAERLAGGVEPRYPYAEHALVATNAALAEARGDLQAASEAYTEAADCCASLSLTRKRAEVQFL